MQVADLLIALIAGRYMLIPASPRGLHRARRQGKKGGRRRFPGRELPPSIPPSIEYYCPSADSCERCQRHAGGRSAHCYIVRSGSASLAKAGKLNPWIARLLACEVHANCSRWCNEAQEDSRLLIIGLRSHAEGLGFPWRIRIQWENERLLPFEGITGPTGCLCERKTVPLSLGRGPYLLSWWFCTGIVP